MSGSISRPGVEGGGGAEGEEGGRREGGKPHGQISQTGKPLDSYRISCGSFSLGVVKVTPTPSPRQSLTSSLPSGWCQGYGGGASAGGGGAVGSCPGAYDLEWRENTAALNMHGPSYRMSIIQLLFGLSQWHQQILFPGFFVCLSAFSRPAVGH